MERFKKWRIVLVAFALAIVGGITTLGLSTGPASAATPAAAAAYVYSVSSGHTVGQSTFQGQNTTWFVDEGGVLNPAALKFVGTVDGTNGNCWPFTCGNGANATFQGKNVYVNFRAGTSLCWQLESVNQGYFSTSCGASHPYSMWVQAKAPDQLGSAYEGWVNVGATNAAGGTNKYLYNPCNITVPTCQAQRLTTQNYSHGSDNESFDVLSN